MSGDILEVIVGEAEAPMVVLLRKIPHPNIEYTLDENDAYSLSFVRSVSEYFNLNLTEDELKICVSVASCVLGQMYIEYAERLEAVVDLPVGETSWMWLLRENCHYRLLGVLSSKNDDYERMEELLIQLKPNKEKYEELLSKYKA